MLGGGVGGSAKKETPVGGAFLVLKAIFMIVGAFFPVFLHFLHSPTEVYGTWMTQILFDMREYKIYLQRYQLALYRALYRLLLNSSS